MINIFSFNLVSKFDIPTTPALFGKELPRFLKKMNSILAFTTSSANILIDYCTNTELSSDDSVVMNPTNVVKEAKERKKKQEK